MCKILLSYIFSIFNMLFFQQPLLSHWSSHLPAGFLILCDSDGGVRTSSTWITWNFLEMQSLRLTQTSWFSITFEQDLPVKSFLSHGQILMSDNLWFPRTVIWQFEIECMNHPNTYCVWTGGSRMFCATYPTYLFAFIFWKSCLYIIIQLYVISMHLSASFPVESVFITGSFHPSSIFPTTASCRGWRDFPQAQPCLDVK